MSRFGTGFLTNTPPVVKNLIIINVVLWVASLIFLQFLQVNLNFLLGIFYVQSPLFKPWQIVTHMFMKIL